MADPTMGVFPTLEGLDMKLLVLHFGDDFGKHRGAVNVRSADGDRAVFLLQELDLIENKLAAGFGIGHTVNPKLVSGSESQASGTVTDDCVHRSRRIEMTSRQGAPEGPNSLPVGSRAGKRLDHRFSGRDLSVGLEDQVELELLASPGVVPLQSLLDPRVQPDSVGPAPIERAQAA